jgi:hypothetical protein
MSKPKTPYHLRYELEEMAKLEEEHNLCGVRFCLKHPEITYTASDIVRPARQVIDHVIDLSSRLGEIPLIGKGK